MKQVQLVIIVYHEAAQSLMIIVYVRFLETLLKDLTNGMNSENFAL